MYRSVRRWRLAGIGGIHAWAVVFGFCLLWLPASVCAAPVAQLLPVYGTAIPWTTRLVLENPTAEPMTIAGAPNPPSEILAPVPLIVIPPHGSRAWDDPPFYFLPAGGVGSLVIHRIDAGAAEGPKVFARVIDRASSLARGTEIPAYPLDDQRFGQGSTLFLTGLDTSSAVPTLWLGDTSLDLSGPPAAVIRSSVSLRAYDAGGTLIGSTVLDRSAGANEVIPDFLHTLFGTASKVSSVQLVVDVGHAYPLVTFLPTDGSDSWQIEAVASIAETPVLFGNGSLGSWDTELTVLNPTDHTITLALSYRGGPSIVHLLSLAPHESAFYPSTSGTVSSTGFSQIVFERIDASAAAGEPIVFARLTDRVGAIRRGASLPEPGAGPAAIPAGTTFALPALARNGSLHANLLVSETTGQAPASVHLTSYDDAGTILGEADWALAAGESRFVVDVLGTLGVGSVDLASIEGRVDAGSVEALASVVSGADDPGLVH
jgi:hypothetical protein